ncbi:MAG: DUF3611 family protein [Cyanobacteriota bacterium]|nr:DUF3611 family protein [Cyanobacteriota bacterium]
MVNMFNLLMQGSTPPKVQEVASAFRRWGRIGFWVQIVFAFIPVIILIFALFINNNPVESRAAKLYIGEFFAFGCLLALVFSIYWCFRYIQLSKKLEDPQQRPSKAEVIQCLWIGLIANLTGMVCAVIVSMARVTTLLWQMLSIPQGASLISSPGEGTMINRGTVIVPLHMVGIQAMLSTIAAELVGIMVALLLLRLISQNHSESS